MLISEAAMRERWHTQNTEKKLYEMWDCDNWKAEDNNMIKKNPVENLLPSGQQPFSNSPIFWSNFDEYVVYCHCSVNLIGAGEMLFHFIINHKLVFHETSFH